MAGGRKKEFDKQEALIEATKIFWKKGYLGASLTDLIQAMGINKPSLYATFGNKEQLFIQVTDYYLAQFATPSEVHLLDSKLSQKQGLKAYIMARVKNQCRSDMPRGCFIALCASESEGGNLPGSAKSRIDNILEDAYSNLLSFFKQYDVAPKNKTDSVSIEAKTLSVFTLLQGTAAMARLGKSPEELEIIVDILIKGMALD